MFPHAADGWGRGALLEGQRSPGRWTGESRESCGGERPGVASLSSPQPACVCFLLAWLPQVWPRVLCRPLLSAQSLPCMAPGEGLEGGAVPAQPPLHPRRCVRHQESATEGRGCWGALDEGQQTQETRRQETPPSALARTWGERSGRLAAFWVAPAWAAGASVSYLRPGLVL